MTLAMAMTTTLLAGQITPQEAAKIKAENPLVREWNTPFQTPPFDSIRTEDYEPAILYAIEEAKKEVNAIIVNRAMPGFENTIVALERAGGLLNRVLGVFFNINECNTSEQLQKIAEDITPALSAYSNDLSMNPLLFSKVKQVYDMRDDIPLTAEQKAVTGESSPMPDSLPNPWSWLTGGLKLSGVEHFIFTAVCKARFRHNAFPGDMADLTMDFMPTGTAKAENSGQ